MLSPFPFLLLVIFSPFPLAFHAGVFRGACFSSLPAWEATFPQTESLFKGYSPHKPAIIFYVNHPKSPCYLVTRYDTLNQYNPPGCPLTGAAWPAKLTGILCPGKGCGTSAKIQQHLPANRSSYQGYGCMGSQFPIPERL